MWWFDSVEFDEPRWQLSIGGHKIEAEPRPLEVLAQLLRRAGEVVTKEELLEAVWPGVVVVDAALVNAVAKLRKLLGEQAQKRVITVHRVGYRFAGEVGCKTMAPQPVPRLDLRAGACVPRRDPWRLVEPLGVTPNGEVWLAMHAASAERRVFKFAADGLRLSALKRAAAQSRLLGETLGPRRDLVRVLERNFEEPPYFIECEYGGPDLERWAGGVGGLQSRPLEERIGLLAAIAETVAAAHLAGVLHRDLKPRNILVDMDAQGRPQPRLTDFGGARPADADAPGEPGAARPAFTATRGLDTAGGTLFYVAPEVLTGQLPTALSDIYALGVMLYQLAVGDLRRPLAAGWERDIADELLREDIAASADVNPAHRLSDAASLARRLRCRAARREERERQREQQAEVARLRLSLERARARRGWVAAAIGLLLVGLAGTLALYGREARARAEAERAQATASAINTFTSEYMLGDGATAGRGRNARFSEVLESASNRLDRDLGGQPAVYGPLSLSIGEAWLNLGFEDRARERWQKALSDSAALPAYDPQTLASLRNELGFLLDDQGNPSAAEGIFKASLAHCREHLGERDYLTFQARDGLAWSRSQQGYFTEAAARYHALLADMKAAGAPAADIAEINWYLGEVDVELHQWDESDAALRHALDSASEDYGSDRPETMWVLLGVLTRQLDLHQWNEAMPALRDLHARATRLLDEDHHLPIYGLLMLAQAYNEQRQPAQAMPLLDEAQQRVRSFDDPHHYLVRLYERRRGEAYLRLGRIAEAQSLLRHAFQVATEAVGAEHPDTVEAERLLADAEAAAHDEAGAERHYRDALAEGLKRMPADNLRLVDTHRSLGRLLLAQGRKAEAVAEDEQALNGYQARYGATDDRTRSAADALAQARSAGT